MKSKITEFFELHTEVTELARRARSQQTEPAMLSALDLILDTINRLKNNLMKIIGGK